MKTISFRFLSTSVVLIILCGIIPMIIGGYLAQVTPAITVVPRENIPYQSISFFEQTAAVFSGFIVKPTYMALSLILILYLWKRNDADLILLRWGLISFLAGEAACAINYIFFNEISALMEYLHSFGMVIGIALIVLASIEGIDKRILRFTAPNETCALINICKGCSKYKTIPCKLRQLFQFALFAFIAISAIPLTANLLPVSYNTTIWGTLYNYSHAIVHQLYEIKYSPWAAIIFFTGSLAFLIFGKEKWMLVGKLLFSFGIGHISFSFLRMVLLNGFQANMVWFVFWEETTELVLIMGIGFILWKFNNELFLPVKKLERI